MTEPIPTNPAPTAIPWTPDMMSPQSPLTVQPLTQPQQPQFYQESRYQQAAPFQNQSQYPQPQLAAQSYAGQKQNMAEQQLSQHVPPQPQMPRVPQPHSSWAQPTSSHYDQAQLGHASLNPVQPISQHPQAGLPRLAPHMGMPAPAENLLASSPDPEPKSLFAKLLKRSPKPVAVKSDMVASNSGSLFNKNFALGAVTGLVVGAFVLPMALNMIGGDASVQARVQAAPMSIVETTPTVTEGNTFIDEAIAADAP